jgi:hypothetical protein
MSSPSVKVYDCSAPKYIPAWYRKNRRTNDFLEVQRKGAGARSAPLNNPQKWDEDEENPQHEKGAVG